MGLSLCDIGTGEFVRGSLDGGVFQDVLAMAKPLFHYRDDRRFKDLPFKDLYPHVNAGDENEIAAALVDYASLPEFYKNMGEEARRWYQRHFVEEPVRRILEIIQTKTPQPSK